MLKQEKKRLPGEMILLVIFLSHVQCCRIITVDDYYDPPDQLTMTTLTSYNIQQEHLESIQYYLSEQVELSQRDSYSYEYYFHGIKQQKTVEGKIIFRQGLQGRYANSGYRTQGFLCWKTKSKYFDIHFEELDATLKFEEDKSGIFRLVTRDGKVNLEGRKYTCVSGQNAYLQIASLQLPDKYGKDRYVKGAPYPGMEVCTFPWELLLAAAGVFFFAQYLDIQ